MTLRSADVLSVCRDLRAGTWEDVVVECFRRGACRLAGHDMPDSNRVYPCLAKLAARGAIARTGPHRWALPEVAREAQARAAKQARAAERLSAMLDAHAQRLTADMIREREALQREPCAWCGKRATVRDEAGDPCCAACADIDTLTRKLWAKRDARRQREIRDVYREETGA